MHLQSPLGPLGSDLELRRFAELEQRVPAISRGLDEMHGPDHRDTLGEFLRGLGQMGGIVEEWMEAAEAESPSVQVQVHADGRPNLYHQGLTGVLFFMIGPLSQFGELGVTAIGNSHEGAEALYEDTQNILDRTVGATEDTFGKPRSHLEPDAPRMV